MRGSTGFAFAPAGDASLLFPPQHTTKEQAREELAHTLGQPPERFGQPGTRWRLATLGQVVSWLEHYSRTGISAALARLGIGLKRGQLHLQSPDPQYVEKLAHVSSCLEQARGSAGRVVLVFADELTFYRQPSVAPAYAPEGQAQPRAPMSHKSNTSGRVAGVLNALTGQVTFLQASIISVPMMVRFWRMVVEDYPHAERIYIATDNWPVHFHPDVLAALEEQEHPFPTYLPESWKGPASRKAKRLNLPIQMLPLPTYAPWTNPIEKLWKWLKQDVLHMHRKADDWPGLKEDINAFLAQFRHGSEELLRYVGLTANSKLYAAALGLAST